MQEDYARDLLRRGIIEAKAGDRALARRYLDRAIYASGSHDALAEGWYWMSQAVDDPGEKRRALENCLSHDLRHARARRALAILDGKINADEIINPDQLPPAPEGFRLADAQRFMCPRCGGRMAYAPDGASLVCEYCTRGQELGLTARSVPVTEKDFITTMATLKGHGRPLQEQVFHCQGCGSEFLLPPRLISTACLYCGSPYVVSLDKTADLLTPDCIIPHAFHQKRATHFLIEWVQKNKIQPEKQAELPRGLYLPLWTFDLGGTIDYTAEIIRTENDDNETLRQPLHPQIFRIDDQYPVMLDDLPVPAARKLSGPLLQLASTYDMKSVKPYDARYLADWPAEVYDISMADASLDARGQAYARIRRDLLHLLNNTKIVHTSSANLTVESFKLVLLPVWMTELSFNGRDHLVLINGQNGEVASDIESETTAPGKFGSLLDFLSDLLDDG